MSKLRAFVGLVKTYKERKIVDILIN